jgi:hypothetical protein
MMRRAGAIAECAVFPWMDCDEKRDVIQSTKFETPRREINYGDIAVLW